MSEEDLPIICERCIGNDKYVKMIRQPHGEECKLCTRPFTVYRWRTARNASRMSKTLICPTCARIRHSCQICMLDIVYGIPIDIRDTALKMAGLEDALHNTRIPQTSNKEIKAIFAEKEEERFNNEEMETSIEKRKDAEELLKKLSDRLKDKETNTNVSEERRKEEKLKKVDVSKIIHKLPFKGLVLPPQDDTTVTSFFIFGFSQNMPQYVLSDYCKKFGELKSITVIHRAKCGFVSFLKRRDAEAFSMSIINNGINKSQDTPGILLLDMRYTMRVSWGKIRPLGLTNEEQYRLGLVVSKVMKQLAEKDEKPLVAQSKALEEPLLKNKVLKRENSGTERAVYSALRADYEL